MRPPDRSRHCVRRLAGRARGFAACLGGAFLLLLLLAPTGDGPAAGQAERARGAISTDARAAAAAPVRNAAALRTRLQATMQATPGRAAAGEADTSSVARSLDEATDTAWSIGSKVVAALLVLIAAFYFIRGVVYVLGARSERSATHRLLYKRLVPIARLGLWFIALYVVIAGVLGIGARQLVAASAAVGVAVGLAAQDLLKNVFGGLVIIFDQPFQTGDKIEVNDAYGEVVAIGLRSTRIVTADDNLVTVPNAQVVDGQVSNANASALDCQVVTDLYLPHDADEALAERVASEAATNSKYTYLEEPVVVIVKEEFDQKPILHLKVKAYVLDTRHEFLLMSDVTKRARRAFRDEGLLRTSSAASAPLTNGALSPAESPPEARPLHT